RSRSWSTGAVRQNHLEILAPERASFDLLAGVVLRHPLPTAGASDGRILIETPAHVARVHVLLGAEDGWTTISLALRPLGNFRQRSPHPESDGDENNPLQHSIKHDVPFQMAEGGICTRLPSRHAIGRLTSVLPRVVALPVVAHRPSCKA